MVKGNVFNGVVDIAQGVVTTVVPGIGVAGSIAIAAGGVAVKHVAFRINNKKDWSLT